MGHGRSLLPTALVGGIIHVDAARSRPTIPKIPHPSPALLLLPIPATSPRGIDRRGVPKPRPPSQEPTAHLPNEEQMGRHQQGGCSRAFDTFLANPRGFSDAFAQPRGAGRDSQPASEYRWIWES